MPGKILPTAVPMKRSAGSDLYLISENDIVYEQDIYRNPGGIKSWLEYAAHKKQHGNTVEIAFVLERAVSTLPRSYKLWKMYLEFRVHHLRGKNPAKYAPQYVKVNELFERALVLLNKMPRIWEMYLEFLMKQPMITTTRRTFDRSLRALPLTQHNRIWALYRPFAMSASGETAIRIWKRYLQVHPEDTEDYIKLLEENRRYTEAVQQYLKILNNPTFKSKEAKGPFQLWTEMLEILMDHADEVRTGAETGIDVERIVRSGIDRHPDQRGILWASLATYWTNLGYFEKARDAYEEGLGSVLTARDFTTIFDNYSETEEAQINILLDEAKLRSDKGVVDGEADFELDVRMLRFELLLNRRPFLLNDVLLRQNPNNVHEWKKRVALWGDNKDEVIQTYQDALTKIDPLKANGRLCELYVDYSKFFESLGHVSEARNVLDKASRTNFKSVQELADLYCEWAELELRNENFDGALSIMAKATLAPKRSKVNYFDEDLSAQQRLHKSWKLWSFYVDLVESVGTLEETRAVYDRIFELRIATPQTVVNYANLLEENEYFEDSYKIYERGLDLFSYPVAFELWNLYLTKAVERQISIERLRDLFEQAVEDCPPRFAKTLYLMYGALEEERGLARHAMRIYERATRAVSDEDRPDMFNFYITKSASNFGLTSTRPIYERAIAALPDSEAKEMCMKFAEMERRLGEIDRARAIYGHASQFCDPRTSPAFWTKWEQFEVSHGNEDTFKEMLRIKRSVQAQYNTDINYIASQALARSQQQPDASNGVAASPHTNGDNGAGDAMAQLERHAKAPVGFVAASTGPEGGDVNRQPVQDTQQQQQQPENPDAIELDDI